MCAVISVPGSTFRRPGKLPLPGRPYRLLSASGSLKENDGTYPNDVYYVFTVQEEVGCRGSKVTAARIQPDFGFAVDITPAHDYPCDLQGSNTVDGGIGIKICDPSVVCDPDLVASMEECCERDGIKYQREVIDKGGTDASSMNLSNWGERSAASSPWSVIPMPSVPWHRKKISRQAWTL